MMLRKFWSGHQILQKAIKRTKKRSKLIIILFATILLLGSASTVFSIIFPTFAETSASSSTGTDLIQSSIGTTRLKPQFNVDVLYAYTGENKYESAELNSTFNGVPMHPVSLYPLIIYLNFTHVSNAEAEACDAEIEVYIIEITADTGQKESYTCFFGTNYDPNFSEADVLNSAISQIDSFAGARSTNGITGIFNPNMSTNQSLWFKVGSLDSDTSRPSGLGLWSSGEPAAITIKVYRMGCIAVNDAETSTSYANSSDTVQVSLTKSGEGFLYNKIPQDKMAQSDAFHPIDLYKPLE
jgi:hypothetical protein